MQNICTDNQKIVLKVKYLGKSQVNRKTFVFKDIKVTVLPRTIYKFNDIHIKFLGAIFTEMET